MADITYLQKDIFNSLKKEAKKIAGILYCPPNYLRMSMYLELSRPAGDVSRWEKVLKRLSLLNKHHPLKANDCKDAHFQRGLSEGTYTKEEEKKIYDTVKNTLIGRCCIFWRICNFHLFDICQNLKENHAKIYQTLMYFQKKLNLLQP